MTNTEPTISKAPTCEAKYDKLTTMQSKVWPILKQLNYKSPIQLNTIIGNQTVDFYCPQLKLAIIIRTSDITGSTRDAYEEYFNRLDIKVIFVSYVDMLLHAKDSRNKLMSQLIQRQREF